MASPNHHFLIVTSALQGHINPTRHLARRLARIAKVDVTLALPISSHRRMFPGHANPFEEPVDDGHLVSYAAYSGGFDQGFHPDAVDGSFLMSQFKTVGSETLTRLARALAGRGRPVTCLVYTILLSWAADLARDSLGIPAVLYWVQPAAVFSIFYHYVHGRADEISSNRNDPSFALSLPGLPRIQIHDLPSMIAEHDSPLLEPFVDIIQAVEKDDRRRVLINTFHALEVDAIEAMNKLNIISVGPITEKVELNASIGNDLFEQDKSTYVEWLDSQEEMSVVYVSFGSLTKFSHAQMEELSEGLKGSGRPYLWVIRRDATLENASRSQIHANGMVVEWCDQVKVLSHRSVGCFVTHCGWNSTMESIVGGVPMVMMPQWVDQRTNAKLAEGVWGAGVRAEVNRDGVVEGTELKRCLDVVMGEGARGAEIREKAKMWKVKAGEAVSHDGPSVRSLLAFVHEL